MKGQMDMEIVVKVVLVAAIILVLILSVTYLQGKNISLIESISKLWRVS